VKCSFIQVILMTVPLALLGCSSDSDAGQQREEVPKAGATPSAQAPAVVKHELPGDPVAGKAVYDKICFACHAADGRGNGGITGADFIADRSRLAKSNEELYKSVAEGQQTGNVPMPPQLGPLNEQEIKDALAFVRVAFGDS
jgi:mono/diheme cytochrome c family protein